MGYSNVSGTNWNNLLLKPWENGHFPHLTLFFHLLHFFSLVTFFLKSKRTELLLQKVLF